MQIDLLLWGPGPENTIEQNLTNGQAEENIWEKESRTVITVRNCKFAHLLFTLWSVLLGYRNMKNVPGIRLEVLLRRHCRYWWPVWNSDLFSWLSNSIEFEHYRKISLRDSSLLFLFSTIQDLILCCSKEKVHKFWNMNKVQTEKKHWFLERKFKKKRKFVLC